MIISNASLLLGTELDFVKHGYVEIENGVIKKAAAGSYDGSARGKKIFDASEFLVIPGLINAHTHIADSIGKDIGVGQRLDARVHPLFGAKKKILQKSSPDHLKAFIRSSAVSMMKKGIVAFSDFREGGLDGVRLLQDAVSGLPVKSVILGRAEHYLDPKSNERLSAEVLDEAAAVMQAADGLGISGANENADGSLEQYGKLKRKGKLIAIHAAESKETAEISHAQTGRSEIGRIMQHLKPDFVVHMTNATDDDISMVAENNTGVVVCPRANGVLGAGIPKVANMLERNCTVAIGTDNVMLNSPDILRELDYLWKVSRATEPNFISPKEILKMATVNAAKILKLNSGCIEASRAADLVFIEKNNIDLHPMHDPYASIVHRAGENSIRAVMIDGRFVAGV